MSNYSSLEEGELWVNITEDNLKTAKRIYEFVKFESIPALDPVRLIGDEIQMRCNYAVKETLALIEDQRIGEREYYLEKDQEIMLLTGRLQMAQMALMNYNVEGSKKACQNYIDNVIAVLEPITLPLAEKQMAGWNTEQRKCPCCNFTEVQVLRDELKDERERTRKAVDALRFYARFDIPGITPLSSLLKDKGQGARAVLKELGEI